MKKIIISLFTLILIVGCGEANTTPTVEPTPVQTVMPETTFKEVDINGLFKIKVVETLPEQMELVINAINETSGKIELIITSNNAECTLEDSCTSIPFSYLYGTEEDAMVLDEKIEDAITTIKTEDNDFYIWKCYTCGLNYIVKEGAPGYYEDYLKGDPNILDDPNQLIRFE